MGPLMIRYEVIVLKVVDWCGGMRRKDVLTYISLIGRALYKGSRHAYAHDKG